MEVNVGVKKPATDFFSKMLPSLYFGVIPLDMLALIYQTDVENCV